MSETKKRIGSFLDNGDGTVTDTRTGLMWMRCAIGQTWDGETCQGRVKDFSLSDALEIHRYVNLAGHNDWRLPNIDELNTLFDNCNGNPVSYNKAFPEGSSLPFLSTSGQAAKDNASLARTTSFNVDDGSLRRGAVRLVRGTFIPYFLDATIRSLPVTQSDEFFYVTIPTLPALVVCGSTKIDALKNAGQMANLLVYKLCAEVEELTKQFAHIDYTSFPEFGITTQVCQILSVNESELIITISKINNQLEKFFRETANVIKSGKSILAMRMLSCIFNTKGQILFSSNFSRRFDDYCKRYTRQFVALFMEAFIQLERYDILVKYYKEDPTLSHSLEFMQLIVEYYISIKDVMNASDALDKLRALEPCHPFVAQSLKRIKTIAMIRQLGDSNIDMGNMDALSGQDFESLLIQHFTKIGFAAQGTPGSGDFGADILVDTKDGTRFVIQCKRFKNKVNLKAVQEVVGAMPHYNGDIGIVITSNGFLPSAVTLAKSNGIELWGSMELMSFLTGDLSFSQLAEWG